jgi:hypothetical protein
MHKIVYISTILASLFGLVGLIEHSLSFIIILTFIAENVIIAVSGQLYFSTKKEVIIPSISNLREKREELIEEAEELAVLDNQLKELRIKKEKELAQFKIERKIGKPITV